ncbi:MAG: hypothetical protein AAF202_09800 [Pseudomonadota bacterium]
MMIVSLNRSDRDIFFRFFSNLSLFILVTLAISGAHGFANTKPDSQLRVSCTLGDRHQVEFSAVYDQESHTYMNLGSLSFRLGETRLEINEIIGVEVVRPTSGIEGALAEALESRISWLLRPEGQGEPIQKGEIPRVRPSIVIESLHFNSSSGFKNGYRIYRRDGAFLVDDLFEVNFGPFLNCRYTNLIDGSYFDLN